MLTHSIRSRIFRPNHASIASIKLRALIRSDDCVHCRTIHKQSYCLANELSPATTSTRTVTAQFGRAVKAFRNASDDFFFSARCFPAF